MSSPIKKETATFIQNPVSKDPVAVTAYVKEKGNWKKVEITEKAHSNLKNILNVIQEVGEQFLREPGSKLEVTGRAILHEKKDLLNLEKKEGIESNSVRQRLAKSVEKVANKITLSGNEVKIKIKTSNQVPLEKQEIELNRNEKIILKLLSNDCGAAYRAITSDVEKFVSVFKKHREEFEDLMRQAGFSDRETALFYNHYEKTLKARKNWDEKFQKQVESKLKNNDIHGAVKAFAKMIRDEFESYRKETQDAAFSAARLGESEAAFITFWQKHHFQDTSANQLFSRLSLVRPLTSVQMNFEAILKEAIAGGVIAEGALPSKLEEARQTLKEEMKKFNDAQGKIDQLSVQKLKLASRIDQLKNEDARKWEQFVKAKNIKPSALKTLSRLYEEYGELIQPLQEMMRAIGSESSSQKKRALSTQLKLLAQDSLNKALELGEKYRKIEGNRLLKELALYEGEEKSASSSSVHFFEESMKSRLQFLQKVFKKTGFARTPPLLEALLTSQRLSDPAFRKHLTPHLDYLFKLSNWHEAFREVADPLLQLHQELNKDSENPLLQEKLRKTVLKNLTEIKKFILQFNNKLGGIESLFQLNNPLASYQELVSKQDKQIKVPMINRQIIDYLDAVDSLHIVCGTPMSWDKDFLQFPLKMLNDDDQVVFEKFLRQKGLNLKDYKEIDLLFQGYQKALRKVIIAERELEAHPENDKLAVRLMSKLDLRRKTLRSLEEAYRQAESKIFAFDKVFATVYQKLFDKYKNRGIPDSVFMIGNLNLTQAFDAKRAFMFETYERFERSL